MSTEWSTKIQGINTLNLNRAIRFTDRTFKNILNIIDIKEYENIIEFGCGPGTFTRRLSNFYPDMNITGLDFDYNFVNFSKEEAKKENIKNINYVQGDALNTSFEDESFDVCTSHTVIEHLPNKEFLEEQFRLLKAGGKLIVLNARADFALRSTDSIEVSDRETTLIKKIEVVLEDLQSNHQVAKYSANPQEILRTIESVGFKDIQLDVIPYVICVDDKRNTLEYKIQVLESEKNTMIEFIMMAINNNSNALSDDELKELLFLLEERFNKRINMIKSNQNIWDLSITPTLVITGIKPC